MMIVVLMLFVGAVLVVARSTPHRDMDLAVDCHPLAHWVKWSGIIPITLLTAFLLLVGVGDLLGGKLSGSGYLILAAPLVVLVVLIWQQPAVGGLVLLSVGVLLSAYIWMIMPGGVASKLEAVGATGGPFLLSGLLRAAVGLASPSPTIHERSPWQTPPTPTIGTTSQVNGRAPLITE